MIYLIEYWPFSVSFSNNDSVSTSTAGLSSEVSVSIPLNLSYKNCTLGSAITYALSAVTPLASNSFDISSVESPNDTKLATLYYIFEKVAIWKFSPPKKKKKIGMIWEDRCVN